MKNFIAAVLVCTWALQFVIILTVVLLGFVDFERGMEIARTSSSISSGLVGIVVGHYFSYGGRAD